MNNNEIYKRVVVVLRPYASKLVIAMAAMIVVGGFNALQAYMVKPLLDEIFYKHDGRLLNLLPLRSDLMQVFKPDYSHMAHRMQVAASTALFPAKGTGQFPVGGLYSRWQQRFNAVDQYFGAPQEMVEIVHYDL